MVWVLIAKRPPGFVGRLDWQRMNPDRCTQRGSTVHDAWWFAFDHRLAAERAQMMLRRLNRGKPMHTEIRRYIRVPVAWT